MAAYATYWLRMVRCAVSGGAAYRRLQAVTLLLAVVGAAAYAQQIKQGFVVTNLSDQVAWGAFIANFTFLVGIAAAAVLLVVPTYVYHRDDTKKVVLLGEMVAISAIVMCLLFVTVDMGRPDRILHMMPVLGRMNFPSSILAWDVIVLTGYLLLNLHVPGYLLYQRYRGREASKWAYLPFVLLSIAWAISIHTVTAFLYSGLGGRPFWNSALMAPRFLVSAFASGPALLLLVFHVIDRYSHYEMPQSIFAFLSRVIGFTLPLTFFLMGCEIFKEFYTDSLHVASAQYLYFGIHGHGLLQPYIWGGMALLVGAMTVFVVPSWRANRKLMVPAAIACVLGIWVEKGMGLLVPGFVPSPLGDLVEYTPSLVEFLVCVGIWSFGILLLATLSRVALAIQSGELAED